MGETLTFRLDYADPIELTALSKSLTRLGQRYIRFAKAGDVPESTLVIKRIEQHCIVIDLAPLAVVAGAIASTSDPIATSVLFVQNLKTIIDYFLGKGEKPSDLSRIDCDDAREIVQPIAVQRDGNFLIQASGNAEVNVRIELSPVEANAIQNRAIQEKVRLTEATSSFVEKEIFYWQVADKDKAASEGQTPDRGVIEAVDKSAKKIFFSDPALKANLIAGGHPFETGYFVDAEVLTAKGRIQGYKILAVYDSFPLED